MTVEEFKQEMKKLLTVDVGSFDNGKDFTTEFKSGKHFFQVSLYIKELGEIQKHFNFLIDEDKVEELKRRCEEVNKNIDIMLKEVHSENHYPSFAHFYRSSWDLGYEVAVYERDKAEEEAVVDEDEERHQDYIKKHGYDPCEHCHSNCHTCKLGFRDDGNYSKYDVYNISELI